MLDQIFAVVLGLSLTASVMIVVILISRVVLKGKKGLVKRSAFVFLWILVLLRLALPFSIGDSNLYGGNDSPAGLIYQEISKSTSLNLSLNPYETQDLKADILINNEKGDKLQGIFSEDNSKNIVEDKAMNIPTDSLGTANLEESKFAISDLFPVIWISIAIIMIFLTLTSYAIAISKINQQKNDSSLTLLADRVRTKMGLKRKIIVKSGNKGKTAVYGIFRPVIFIDRECLPYAELILTHELVHVKNHDNLKKLVANFCRCIHWFNPLVWVALKKMEEDIETACDEKVLSYIGYDERKTYASAIFDCASINLLVERRKPLGIFSGFGKHPVTTRIRHLLEVKEKSKALPLIAFVTVILLLMGTLINPALSINNGDDEIKQTDIKKDDSEQKFVSTFFNATSFLDDGAEILDFEYHSDEMHILLKTKENTFKYVITTETGELVSERILSTEKGQPVGKIHVEGDKLYFFAQKGMETGLMVLDTNKGAQEIIYKMESAEAMPVLSGGGGFLSWYEEKELVIFDLKTYDVETSIETLGIQNYAGILDGYIAYQGIDELTGKVFLYRYNIATKTTDKVQSLLGENTFSAFANEDYLVYKEEFKNNADIIICDLREKNNLNIDKTSAISSISLWTLLASTISEEEAALYKEGKWGISLIKDKLILTGEGDTILAVDIPTGSVEKFSANSNGVGFYNPKVSGDSMTALQFENRIGTPMESGTIYLRKADDPTL